MIETLFFLDKLILSAVTSYFGNPVNAFGTLVGIWLVAEVALPTKKNKEGKK